jgi:hypothetical protein
MSRPRFGLSLILDHHGLFTAKPHREIPANHEALSSGSGSGASRFMRRLKSGKDRALRTSCFGSRFSRSAEIAVGLFARPVPRGSWAAWAAKPQALSPVAATTCRVRMAAWKARRGSAKVGLNETFTAKFQHLYTSVAWPFLGWSGARETLSVVSTVHCRRFSVHGSRLIGELCSRIGRGSRVASPGRRNTGSAGW